MSQTNEPTYNITECPFCDGICTAACISQPIKLTKEQKKALSETRKEKYRKTVQII